MLIYKYFCYWKFRKFSEINLGKLNRNLFCLHNWCYKFYTQYKEIFLVCPKSDNIKKIPILTFDLCGTCDFSFFFCFVQFFLSFLWGHWYPCFGLLVTSVLAMIDPSWVLSHLCDHMVHLWCDTCLLYRGQHGIWAFLIHIPADMSKSIGGGLGNQEASRKHGAENHSATPTRLSLEPFLVVGIIEFFTIHVSVRLSDRSKVAQNKINFIKNCSQWGLNSLPQDHQSTALSTVLSHYLVVLVNH